MCVEDGEVCAMNSDCCSGSCDPQTLTCKACRATGMTCTASADCCANFCDPQTLTCSVIVQ
jgi:hypothetical protein